MNQFTNKPALIIAGMLMLLLWLPSNGQVRVPFIQRTSQYSPEKKIYNIKGDFQMIGNTNLTLETYDDNEPNSNNQMIYVDVDGITSTLNSSSATLAFPVENNSVQECSNIIYAGLYWIGRAHDGGTSSPNTFSVTKTVPDYNNPTLNTTNYTNILNNGNITNTNYTLTISQQGTSNEYYPRYTFTSSAGGPTVIFESQLSTATPNFNVRYSTDGGTTWTNASNQVVSTPATNRCLITFTPVSIYSNTDGTSLKVTSLYRDSRNERTLAQMLDGRTYANVEVKYNTYPNVSVTKNFDKSVVSLKHASEAGYFTVNATDVTFTKNIYYPTTTDGYMYSAYAEVTDYVKSHGLGAYTVADIALREGNGGSTGFFGGWGMIVVYENSKMKWRDVTIFDGHAYVQGNTTASYQLPVDGFRTAQNGSISMKLGLIAGEGDRSISGDFFQILPHDKLSLTTPAETDWISLSHSGNSTNNFFNSSIPAPANSRYPQYTNNTGVDIAMFNITNTNNTIVTNNQTSTKFRYGSTQDTYIIPCIAMAVDAYVPDMVVDNTVALINNVPYTSGMVIKPGEEIQYDLLIYNKGNEQIDNARLVIPIPYSATFVQGSLTGSYDYPGYQGTQPYFNATLGVSGSIVWEGGIVPLPPTPETLLGTLSFKLKATTDCFIIANQNCVPRLTVDGTTSGVGHISGTAFDNVKFIQGYHMNGACQGEPIYDPVSILIDGAAYIAANCPVGQDYTVQHFKYCYFTRTNIPFADVIGKFPPGTRYYSALEPGTNIPTATAIEYTSASGFPNTVGTKTYFAVPPGITTCWWEFTIEVDECNLWYGTTNEDWGTASNWTAGHVPNGASESVIFATPINYGQQAIKDLWLDQDRVIGDVINHSDKKLIIPVNRTLVVDKKADTGNAPQLVIQSEVGQANGALIFNSPLLNQTVQATVEFASKSEPGSGTWPRVWQFFGVPVVNRTLANLFGTNVQGSIYGGDPTVNEIVRKHNEALNLSYSNQEKWEDLEPTHVMKPYEGYEITQPAANMKHSFAGTLVTDMTKTLTFNISPSGTYARGNFMLANPFTAPIFISKMLPSDFENLAQTIYIYNTGSRQNWMTSNGASENQIGDLPGTYSAIPILTANTIGKPMIPSMQAFMVKASTYPPTAVSFNFRYPTVYRDGLTYPNEPMKIKRTEAADVKPLLTMDVIGENSSDRVYLITAEGTTKGYDAGWDGYKTLNTDNVVQLYALDIDNKRMQVSTDCDLNDTYIGFRTGGESTYSLRIKFNTEMQGAYESLFVNDLATGITQQITDGTIFNFAAAAGTTEKRFKISALRIKTGVNSSDRDEAIKVTANPSTIRVDNNTNGEVMLKVYNLTGQTMLIEKAAMGVQYINHNLTKGTYLIEAKSVHSGSRTTVKAIIH